MKIAYVYDNIYPYSIGGVEKRVWELATRLTQRGHEVHLFGMKYWDGADVFQKEGIFLHGVCKPYPLFFNGHRSIKEAIYFAWKVLPYLLKEKFDIIDCQNFPYFPCFPAKLYSLRKRTPLVISWYEFWGNYWYEYLGMKGFFGKVVERFVSKLPALIIANSEKVRQDLIFAGVRPEKVTVNANGVNLEEIQKIESRKENFDILYAGRLVSHKNIDLLIKAIKLVGERAGEVTCGIIGDGPEREKLTELVKDLKLNGHIKFLGFLEKEEDVISYMKSSRIFAIPSVREGSPITVVEANACGLPVITVNHKNNGTTTLIEEGVNGFICELSEESVAQQILELLLENGSWLQVHKSSLAKAKNYDWDTIVKDLEDIYREVISGSPAS